MATPVLPLLLQKRLKQGKEDPERLQERYGVASYPRPGGPLIWVHGASVGEAQSSLVLIKNLTDTLPAAHIIVTTGTVTSAKHMASRLPPHALHQFYPLDHPTWVKRFLDHWQPDFVLWMESELWPAMLQELKKRQIPVILVNARLSPRSARRWSFIPHTARILLDTFLSILTQTESDAAAYLSLGATNVKITGNLKYGADPLPVISDDLKNLQQTIGGRPVWLFASTHKGEESMACRLHKALQKTLPDLLTVIVPRHPERGQDIEVLCQQEGLKTIRRTPSLTLPEATTNIYIADTLGELGLFYRACPVVCIGRSFSDDGGGGHNPIEAAQLGCAILHGPHIQNLEQIYTDMNNYGAALKTNSEKELQGQLESLLCNDTERKNLHDNALAFVTTQSQILSDVMNEIMPHIKNRAPTQKDAA